MFDAPIEEVSRLRWRGELPIEAEDWNVGLIVGPSGCGKSTIARHVFGSSPELSWSGSSVIDDFPADLGTSEIADVCRAVGFNTIPAWMRPFKVLSNGEQFRVAMARALCEQSDPIVVDEFTSVVDRQVAQIGSHAIQKLVRRQNRRFVAVTCHYDVVDWLQPDWVFEPGTMTFRRRCLQQRPRLDCEIQRVDYAAWKLFAPYHYLSADLHRSARLFCLFASGAPAAIAATLHVVHPRVRDITSVSRLVTLPDWQGLGLAMALVDKLGAAYKAIERRLRTYPAHKTLVSSFQRSARWRQQKKLGQYSARAAHGNKGGRPCAVFEYRGESMPCAEALALLGQ